MRTASSPRAIWIMISAWCESNSKSKKKSPNPKSPNGNSSRTLQLHALLGAHDHTASHIRMHRAIVFVGARPIEPTSKARSRQQRVYACCAVVVFQPVRCAVVIGPRHGLAGSDCDLSRRERKVSDRDLGATLHRGRRGGEYRRHHLCTDNE